MPINASKARSLCTENEYNLFKWSSVKMSKTLTPSRLKQKVDRARKLRNKYRDLAKQQRGEARGKRKPTGARPAKGNERTVEKAQLFAEVLERFENSLKSAEAAEKKAAGKAGKKTTAKKTKKNKAASKTAKKTVKKAESKKAASKEKVMKKKTSVQSAPKSNKARRAAATVAVALAPGGEVTKPSLGGGGHQSPFGSLVGSSSKSDIDARSTRRQQTSKAAQAGRIESRFARTMQEKIQGHVSGQTKRNQARRDTKS